MSASRTTRRALLGAGIAGAASAAAFGVVSRDGRARTMVLTGRGWRLVRHGVVPGEMPPPGTRVYPAGDLEFASGEPAGSFRAEPAPAGLVAHRLELRDGTILGIGPAGLANESFTVVGGTGTYAGVTGTYHLRQHPIPAGDGSASLTIVLDTPEA